MPKVKATIGPKVSIEANLMKLHIKIKHNEKVCRAQKLSLNAQGQVKIVKILQELAKSEPKAHPKHQRERRTNISTNNRITDDTDKAG